MTVIDAIGFQQVEFTSSFASAKFTPPRLSPKQDVGKWVFGRFPSKFKLYTINEAHKQYSLLDTIFHYMFYLGPPGKYLYLSPQNPLHVGRGSRPTCSGFS